MHNLKKYIEIAKDKGVDDAIEVEASRVFTAPWVKMKCRFGCAGFGKSLCCPPNTPSSDEMRRVLDSYTSGVLLHKHWEKGYNVVNEFNELVVVLEREIFLDGHYKALGLGSGPCMRCDECNIMGSCRKPELARPSMEACGIDVFKTAREHKLPIEVVKTRKHEREVFGLILVD